MTGDRLAMDTGSLTGEQLRAIVHALPMDVTFVDEDGRVAYYSAAYRISERDPGDIGRDVIECHSEATRGTVSHLIDQLRSGEREVAEFVEEAHGRPVRVRYLAVKDASGAYLGVLELAEGGDEPMAREHAAGTR